MFRDLPRLALALLIALTSTWAQAACTAGNPAAGLAETTPDSTFADNGDGTVFHQLSGLIWKRCAEGQTWDGNACAGSGATYTWADALSRARDDTFAGYTDWRLPNIDELQAIVEACGYRPAINQIRFPITPTDHPFWSASTYDPSRASAWIAHFDDGRFGDSAKANGHYVRLVRGGQPFGQFDAASNGNALNTFIVNGNVPPNAGAPFNVVVVTDYNVVADTTVTLRKYRGSGSLGGTTTCTIAAGGNTCTVIGAVWDTVEADAALTANAEGLASQASVAFSVDRGIQAIVFAAPADTTLGAADFTVSATASSGLAVNFASQTAGLCALTDHGNGSATVRLLARGTCTIRAGQSGDANFFAAPAVDRSFFIHQNVGLNDSGHTWCYDGTASASTDCLTHPFPRQDGRYGRDAANPLKLGAGRAGFDYTPLDASRNPVAEGAGATPHPCVRDNVTGLVWEVKTADGGPHDWGWSYTWYSSDDAANGGDRGATGGGSCGGSVAAGCDTEHFVAAVNAVGWCGYTDWRLPTRKELAGLVDHGALSPSIAGPFPNTPAFAYWSATSFAQDSASAWFVDFASGDVGYDHKANSGYVRLVRGGQ